MQKKTINTNGIICLRQNSNIPFQNSSHSIWWTNQKKNGKRIWNWYFIYQFHLRPFMSLNWYPFIKNNNDEQKQNEKWRLSCHLTTDNSNLAKHAPCNSFLSSQDKNQKFLNDTRETSLLTALFFSQFVLSSCLENSSHWASLLLICIPLSIHAIGRRNQDSP